VLDLYKWVLAPLLIAQAARLRKTAQRLPEASGERSGFLPGRLEDPPLRLLFLGDSSAAGVGVALQDYALAYPCAASVHRRTGRSVQWRLLAQSGINTSQAAALLEQHPPGPAEIFVTALGVNDVTSQKTPKQFVNDYRALVRQIQLRTGAAAGVINGLPPMGSFLAIPNPLRWYLGRYAKRLDAQLRSWVATQPQLRHVSLELSSEPSALASDGYHPGLEGYRQWAEHVAQCVAELLQGPGAWVRGIQSDV